MTKFNHCSDCNKKIGLNSKLCQKCYMTKHNPGYIDGRCKKIHYCIDCNKRIKTKSERCMSCAKINISNITRKRMKKNHADFVGENNPMFNKRHSKKTITKISLTKKLTGVHKLDKNSNWRGGKSFEIYGHEFNRELKDEIRERDNYICQNCGMTNEEHIIVLGYELNVHHIDYNKHNNLKNNLITLCNGCNGRANFNRDYWQKKYENTISIRH